MDSVKVDEADESMKQTTFYRSMDKGNHSSHTTPHSSHSSHNTQPHHTTTSSTQTPSQTNTTNNTNNTSTHPHAQNNHIPRLLCPPPSPPFFVAVPNPPHHTHKSPLIGEYRRKPPHTSNITFDDLPPEILHYILQFLLGRDLIRSSRVCALWNTLTDNPALWKPLCLQDSGIASLLETILKNKSYSQAWKWYTEATTRKFIKNNSVKKEGLGCFVFDNGEKYFGEWVNDKFHGIGVCTWPDGRRYQGEFRDGKRGGYGIFTWTNGCRYDGDWDQDKRHGKGKDVWPDTSSYVGEYKYDKFDGYGVFIWDDGGVYEGQWREDQRHGWGKHTWKDGRVYEGEYKLDKFQGERF